MEKQFLNDDTIRMKFSIDSARHGLLKQVGTCMSRYGAYGVMEKTSKKQINFMFEGLTKKLIFCAVALANDLHSDGLTVTLHDVQKVQLPEIKAKILTKKTHPDIRSDDSSNNEDKIDQVGNEEEQLLSLDFFKFALNHSDSKKDLLYQMVNNYSNTVLGKTLTEFSQTSSFADSKEKKPNLKGKEPEIQANKPSETLQENIIFLKGLLTAKDEQLKAKDEQFKAILEQLKTKDDQLKTKDDQLKTKDDQLKTKDDQLKSILALKDLNNK